MQTLRNAENTRSFNNDKGIIHLPWQDCEKPYKSRNNGAKRGIVW